ncbi:MAG: signal peptide peptidase SppA [Ignavibacteriae bacterium]|nr:signal peptide peptidase SppA [Ignavibacteriota bacterium]
MKYFLAFLISFATLAFGQTFPSYYSAADLALASPGALRFGLYGFDNPALLTYVRHSDLEFVWTDASGKWNDFNRWGLFTASPNFGFGLVKTKLGPISITDYRIALAGGDKTLGFGFAYSFTGGDKAAFDRRNSFTLGTLVRPNRYVSVGLVGSTTTSGGRTEGVVDLGVRPLGSEMLTIFADYGIQNHQQLKQGAWSYGAAIEALPGIRVTGRYFNTHAFSVGLSLSLGNAGVSTQSTWDNNSKHAFNTYAIRLGAFDRTVLTKLMKNSRYVEMDLLGGMKYQRFILFDNARTLRSTLDAIAAAKADETVAGIAINTSGMDINREMLWELREQLRQLKAAGKKVVVFIDRPTMVEYQFATIADKIVLDPAGALMLPGFLVGRMYVKGTLDKLGIGFTELRYFKYKSAAESYARDKMSDADREQNQKLVDDLYAQAKAEICEGRKLTAAQFDTLVNQDVMFLPQDALAKGLVDTLGRWEEVKTMIERLEGEKKATTGFGSLAQFNLPYDNQWGERPRIAVIYALGACAMDEGIKARSLVKDVEAVANDTRVKAIVLRVDSPGGDGMASDIVAEALKKAKKNKPVIVSQGYVAASGGYWLSMYADTVVAAPSTITGSIGVIGGWMYNKELKEKLGFSTDLVKAGEHADLGFGFRLPLIGAGIPDRDLTDVERAKAERAIKSFYSEFVAKVAVGRRTTPEKIEPLAQGRIYSGTEGKKVGLVDELGGLADAIRIARTKAGIRPDDDVTIVELPRPGFIDFSRFMPKLFGVEQAIATDPVIEHLKLRLEHNGQPMPVMPLEEIDFEAATE